MMLMILEIRRVWEVIGIDIAVKLLMKIVLQDQVNDKYESVCHRFLDEGLETKWVNDAKNAKYRLKAFYIG